MHNPNEANVDTPLIEAHRHGIALARPLFRAFVLALAGAACFLAPWKYAGVAGAVLLGLAAVIAVTGVGRWERTHLFVTETALIVECGFLSRSSATVALNGPVFEFERSLLGRILGYGTVIAGELEIDCVPRRLMRLVQQRR